MRTGANMEISRRSEVDVEADAEEEDNRTRKERWLSND